MRFGFPKGLPLWSESEGKVGRRSRGPGLNLAPPRGPGAEPLVAGAGRRPGGEAGDPDGSLVPRGGRGCPPGELGSRLRRPNRPEVRFGPNELGHDSSFPVGAPRPLFPGADGVLRTLAQRLAKPASRSGVRWPAWMGLCRPSPMATPAGPDEHQSPLPYFPFYFIHLT